MTDGSDIKLWDIHGSLIKSLVEKLKEKAKVVWSSDGTTLLTTEYGDNMFYGPVRVWDAAGNLRGTLMDEKATNIDEKMTVSTDLSPDGQGIITALQSVTGYGPVQLWRADGQFHKTLIPKIGGSPDHPVGG